MSRPTTPAEENPLADEILKPLTANLNVSTDSVDVVQTAPPTAEERTQAREQALKDRALKRMERRERNHTLAEEEARQGDALLESGDYAGASARFVEATTLWPSNSDFYLKLTKAYLKCELYVEAAHAATRALSFDPKSLEARYERGVARLEQGLLPAAKTDFETVIAHNPTHALAPTSLGRVLTLLQATKIGTHVVSPPQADASPEGEPVDYAFPRYEDDKLELAERSDSSDCNHVGNGVPCRFYNHDGCGRGKECEFSHAPDEKSVRDDLGKNVCLYFLLSACKFGDLKCIYSHTRDALPTTHGWWNDAEQIKRVKAVLELAEKKSKEQRALDALLYRLEGKKGRGKGQPRGGKGRADGKGERKAVGKTRAREGEKGKAPIVAEDNGVKGKEESSDLNSEVEERMANGGFTDYELNELAAQGVKPYDDDARVRSIPRCMQSSYSITFIPPQDVLDALSY
ncbi:hypothetical protein H0H81_010393 [Sphagnurus paluster]|uniref:C3H1-type domain-containing protein n=1 Tax=Sphagnurus paluster TaxID=117069 RepID=A0A9P7FR12_9AGAR|nr:hypothetical protein H0H81_010393 [Sphagnurus paluster]